jgi:hypothetical protein
MSVWMETWCGWPEEDYAGLPLGKTSDEEGGAREFRARATGGRESGAAAADSRADDPRAALPKFRKGGAAEDGRSKGWARFRDWAHWFSARLWRKV